MIKKVTIIDTGAGNLLSIIRAFNKCGAKVEISNKMSKIKSASSIILPGDGAFGHATKLLEKLEIRQLIKDFSKTGKPLLGICLGMQLLFSKSEEFGIHKGLDILGGQIKKIKPVNKDYKIPIIGWNKIKVINVKNKNINALLKCCKNKSFYFVHSFEAISKKKNERLGYYNLKNRKISAIVGKDNIIGTQFHPEKSGKNGINFLNTFLDKY